MDVRPAPRNIRREVIGPRFYSGSTPSGQKLELALFPWSPLALPENTGIRGEKNASECILFVDRPADGKNSVQVGGRWGRRGAGSG